MAIVVTRASPVVLIVPIVVAIVIASLFATDRTLNELVQLAAVEPYAAAVRAMVYLYP
jgi:ABC-type tungstate transport system substrate-binding protein